MSLTIFIVGCEKNEVSKTTFTLSDFQAQGRVYEEGDSDIDIHLGKTKETALVWLVFKEDGTLYTKDDVEDLESWRDGKLQLKVYYTDQTTFYNVTKFWYATTGFVMWMWRGTTSLESVYVMDPLRQEQIPWDEREKRIGNPIK